MKIENEKKVLKPTWKWDIRLDGYVILYEWDDVLMIWDSQITVRVNFEHKNVHEWQKYGLT